MERRLKKEALSFFKLMPPAVLAIVGWEIGKWLF